MENKFDLYVGIGLMVITFCVLCISILLVLSSFTAIDLCQSWCNQNKGQFLFYECQNPPLFSNSTPCSELKTGGYCNLQNESLKCQDILNNITTMV